MESGERKTVCEREKERERERREAGRGGRTRGRVPREGEHRAENIISLGTSLSCLCCHSLR
jgi:hypothetical protein